MRFSTFFLTALALILQAPSWADPPADPQARQLYDHNKEWLSHFPPSFVATNIRGQGKEYAERRQAALDLAREQRDFSVVSELMQALEENSFLSNQIIDILAEWKAKRAIPLLKQISEDAQRDSSTREKARQAHHQISRAKADPPPPLR